VPSHLYSSSFAQRRDWSRLCSPQQEILDYLHDVAARFGVDRLVVPGTRVVSCDWDDARHVWRTTSDDGRSWESDAIIIATGQLHQPAYPAIEGLDRFKGHSFHSAHWDHDYDLRGRRVAVIGTGASAVQFIPEIAEQAQRLVVFQRTGNWFLPRKNRPYPPFVKWVIQHVPGVQAFRRRFIFNYGESLTLMIRHPKTWGRIGHLRSSAFMRWQLKDPGLRRKVWPDYTFGCKRVLFSSAFLPALQRPNVDVVTDAITALSEHGVVTADGTEHAVDCVIYGTGFRTNDFMFPMAVTGAGGEQLAEAWARGAHAHLGMTVPGFPSMFVMYGPNTNTSGGSIIVYLEAQAAYIRQALEQLQRRGAAAIEVRADVEAASDAEVQRAFAGTAWTQCDSWYRNPDGRVIANWPRYMRDYLEQTRELDPEEFTFRERAA
jgi:cation diffusion facilitator CzcD-associated flavoprotein CzcO